MTTTPPQQSIKSGDIVYLNCAGAFFANSQGYGTIFNATNGVTGGIDQNGNATNYTPQAFTITIYELSDWNTSDGETTVSSNSTMTALATGTELKVGNVFTLTPYNFNSYICTQSSTFSSSIILANSGSSSIPANIQVCDNQSCDELCAGGSCGYALFNIVLLDGTGSINSNRFSTDYIVQGQTGTVINYNSQYFIQNLGQVMCNGDKLNSFLSANYTTSFDTIWNTHAGIIQSQVQQTAINLDGIPIGPFNSSPTLNYSNADAETYSVQTSQVAWNFMYLGDQDTEPDFSTTNMVSGDYISLSSYLNASFVYNLGINDDNDKTYGFAVSLQSPVGLTGSASSGFKFTSFLIKKVNINSSPPSFENNSVIYPGDPVCFFGFGTSSGQTGIIFTEETGINATNNIECNTDITMLTDNVCGFGGSSYGIWTFVELDGTGNFSSGKIGTNPVIYGGSYYIQNYGKFNPACGENLNVYMQAGTVNVLDFNGASIDDTFPQNDLNYVFIPLSSYNSLSFQGIPNNCTNPSNKWRCPSDACGCTTSWYFGVNLPDFILILVIGTIIIISFVAVYFFIKLIYDKSKKNKAQKQEMQKEKEQAILIGTAVSKSIQ